MSAKLEIVITKNTFFFNERRKTKGGKLSNEKLSYLKHKRKRKHKENIHLGCVQKISFVVSINS